MGWGDGGMGEWGDGGWVDGGYGDGGMGEWGNGGMVGVGVGIFRDARIFFCTPKVEIFFFNSMAGIFIFNRLNIFTVLGLVHTSHLYLILNNKNLIGRLNSYNIDYKSR